MNTSYYANIRRLHQAGYYNLVSISTGVPDWALPNVRVYKDLAPGWDLVNAYKKNSLPWDRYVFIFKQRLARLDPEKVVEDLGEDAVLLCYEAPGDNCHRHLVAEWLNKHLPYLHVEEVDL